MVRRSVVQLYFIQYQLNHLQTILWLPFLWIVTGPERVGDDGHFMEIQVYVGRGFFIYLFRLKAACQIVVEFFCKPFFSDSEIAEYILFVRNHRLQRIYESADRLDG